MWLIANQASSWSIDCSTNFVDILLGKNLLKILVGRWFFGPTMFCPLVSAGLSVVTSSESNGVANGVVFELRCSSNSPVVNASIFSNMVSIRLEGIVIGASLSVEIFVDASFFAGGSLNAAIFGSCGVPGGNSGSASFDSETPFMPRVSMFLVG